ncbi:NAD(P)H-dependent flavin oxidoreductase [Limosilactobacillus kribbianus]|uniref:NAD(P)H-dependent flavin oxidoreductase n=1 Tax=Limosilactobacillus kribbianus TaxID=2982695 RepID=UPI0022646DB1
MNELAKQLNIKYPIIGGPMAWTSMAPLVGAISEAGALGVLGVGFSPTEVVEEQIKATKQITDKPFAINVTMSSDAEGNLERITEIAARNGLQNIYADSLEGANYKLDQKWFQRWHDEGMNVITKIMSASEAAVADRAGADVIIAKGWEGGGHISTTGTLPLLAETLDVVKNAVVVASGGIADGRGYAAARVMGAAGVEMGTAFLAAKEGNVHENVKRVVVEASVDDLVEVGESTGAPCWNLKNDLTAQVAEVEATHLPREAAPLVAKLASGSLRIGSTEGELQHRGAAMPG